MRLKAGGGRDTGATLLCAFAEHDQHMRWRVGRRHRSARPGQQGVSAVRRHASLHIPACAHKLLCPRQSCSAADRVATAVYTYTLHTWPGRAPGSRTRRPAGTPAGQRCRRRHPPGPGPWRSPCGQLPRHYRCRGRPRLACRRCPPRRRRQLQRGPQPSVRPALRQRPRCRHCRRPPQARPGPGPLRPRCGLPALRSWPRSPHHQRRRRCRRAPPAPAQVGPAEQRGTASAARVPPQSSCRPWSAALCPGEMRRGRHRHRRRRQTPRRWRRRRLQRPARCARLRGRRPPRRCMRPRRLRRSERVAERALQQ